MRWRQVKVSRKGSMQLSIEAIIILVIAIVLLGLGLAFIKGFFKQTSTGLENQIDENLPKCSASESRIISPETIELEAGKANKVDICVYNNAGKDISAAAFAYNLTDCVSSSGTTLTAAATNLKVTSNPGTIPRRDSRKFTVFIQPQATVPAGNTYICKVQFQGPTGATGSPVAIIGPVDLTFVVQ